MTGHFKQLCTQCEKVIAQCKCFNCNQMVKYGVCDECLRLAEDKTECIVNGCTNKKCEGGFVGSICAPCYNMITTGKDNPSTNFIHKLNQKATEAERLLNQLRAMEVSKMSGTDLHRYGYPPKIVKHIEELREELHRYKGWK